MVASGLFTYTNLPTTTASGILLSAGQVDGASRVRLSHRGLQAISCR